MKPLSVLSMWTPIEFNGQACLRTVEIQEVRTNWELTPKFTAAEPSIAKGPPELPLCAGICLAQLSGAICGFQKEFHREEFRRIVTLAETASPGAHAPPSPRSPGARARIPETVNFTRRKMRCVFMVFSFPGIRDPFPGTAPVHSSPDGRKRFRGNGGWGETFRLARE